MDPIEVTVGDAGTGQSREAGGVSGRFADLPGVAPGPIVAVDDPDDRRLDLYRDLKDPAARSTGAAGQPLSWSRGDWPSIGS